MFVLFFIRWNQRTSFLKAVIDENNIDSWFKKYEILALINGLGWGLTAIFFFPTDNTIGQIITLFFIAGISSASIATNSVHIGLAHKFLIIILSPLISSYLYIDLPYSFLLSIILLLYLVFLFKIAKSLSKVYTNQFEALISNKKKEKQLSSAESKLYLAKEIAGIALAERKLSDNFFTVDKTWANLLGFSKELNPFNKAQFEKLLHTDDLKKIKGYFSKSEEEIRNLPKEEIRLKHRTGHWLTFETQSRLINIDDEVIEIRTLTDISYHKNREEELKLSKNNLELYTHKLEHNSKELEQLNTQLKAAFKATEEADSSKSRFFSNLSNDLMLPMEGVIDISNLIDSSDLPEDKRRYLEIIKNSITLSHTLIKDLLDYSRYGDYKIEINYGKFNIRELVSEIIEIFTSLIFEKQINLNFSVESDVPNEFITDRIRLQQILFNIIANAINSTDKGGISVKVSVDTSSAGVMSIYFVISDSGKGLPERTKEHLRFDTENLPKGKEEHNIGLSVTKQLVEFMEGTLSVESFNEGGSIFLISLPIKPSNRHSINLLNQNEAADSTSKLNDSTKVLIAEDDKISQTIISSILEEMRITSKVVGNCEDFYNEAVKNNYDLIIMDCHLSRLTSFNTIEKIRTKQKKVNAPILLISSDDIYQNELESIKEHISGILEKPFSKNDFIKKIKEIL